MNSENKDFIFQQEIDILYKESVNGIIIFRKDEDGVFISRSCNPAFCSMLNDDAKDLLERPFSQIFADEKFLQLNQAYFNLVEYQNGYPVFVNLNRKQYQVEIRLINREEEQQSLIVAFSERWRYSPVFYGNESLLNAIQDAIFIFDVGEDGQFRLSFLNQSHMNATGLDLARDGGKTPAQLVGEEEAKRIIERYQKCVDSQEPIIYEEELYFPALGQPSWWQTQLSPMIIDGKVIQVVGASRDITEKKKTLDRTERLYLEYEALFNETSVPIWVEEVFDENDVNSIHLRRYNPTFERIYGLATEENAGKTVAEIFQTPKGIFEDHSDVGRIIEMYAEVLRVRKPITFEMELTIQGKPVVNMTTLTPVIKNGQIVNLIGSVLDITELRQYQDMLKIEGEMLMSRLNQQTQVLQGSFEDQDDFLTSITMGFQEPLTSILGMVEIVQQATSEGDSRALYILQIQQQVEELLQMVNTILVDNQNLAEEALRIREFDLKALLTRLMKEMVRERPSYKGRLSFEDLLPMTMIWQDQKRVFRILQYLIYKAFEIMTEEEDLVFEASFDVDKKRVMFAARFDLSPKRYAPEEKEDYLKQFDDAIRSELRTGLDIKLIQILIHKVGGDLSYQRVGNVAKVIFSLSLIHHSEVLQSE